MGKFLQCHNMYCINEEDNMAAPETSDNIGKKQDVTRHDPRLRGFMRGHK